MYILREIVHQVGFYLQDVYHHVSPVLPSVKFLYIESDDGPKEQNMWFT
jgi:hypothetical protein